MKKFGYIDKSGSTVISPQFDFCYGFSEGLAAVEIDGVYGFISKQGNFAVPLQYQWAFSFYYGLAPICFKDSKCGYIDKSGKITIPLSFREVDGFFDGLAAVQTETTKGFINTVGEWVFTKSDETMYYSFSEGLCRIDVWGEKEEGYCGYIDTNGEIVIKPQFNDTRDFSEGYAYVETTDGRNVFIAQNGQEVLELEFETSQSYPYFFEGLVSVKIDGKYGFADKSGGLVIEPRFDSAEGFSEGLAAVKIDEKYGYIDKAGKWVIEPIFRYAQRFSEDLAAVIAF